MTFPTYQVQGTQGPIMTRGAAGETTPVTELVTHVIVPWHPPRETFGEQVGQKAGLQNA